MDSPVFVSISGDRKRKSELRTTSRPLSQVHPGQGRHRQIAFGLQLPLSDRAVTAVDFPVSAGNVSRRVAAEVSDQLCNLFDRGEALDQVFIEQLFGIDHTTRDQSLGY